MDCCWKTLTTRDFFVFRKIRFDVCIIDYPINHICLINEHNPDELDRELAMVSLAIREIHASYRSILIARFARPPRDIFIVRPNQPKPLSATLHTVPPEWLDIVSQKYRFLDERAGRGKNHF